MLFGNPDAVRAPAAPVALWVDVRWACFGVEVDGGTITKAPPLVAWSIGRRFTSLYRWAKRKTPHARFAWVYPDGTVSEEWR